MPTTRGGRETAPAASNAPATQPPAQPQLSRAQRKAMIEEDVKHVLEELWDYEPEDVFYKIFKREAKTGGVDDVLALPKKNILELSYRDNATSTAIHPSLLDASRIRMFLFYLNHLHEQGLYPDDGSFRYTSITFEDYETFRKHPDNMIRVRQDDDIRASVPRSFLTPTQTSLCTPAESFKKSIKRDISRPSSTKGQLTLSRSSISPAHVRSTSSSSIEDSSSITDENFLDSQPDCEPSPSINQLFHEMMGSSPITNGEGGSLEPHANSSSSICEVLNGEGGSLESCAISSSSFHKEINGDGGPPSPSETSSLDIKCSDIDYAVKDNSSAKEINSFSPATNREPLFENGCEKSTYDYATSIDRSFERSIVSSDVVGRSLGHHHQAYDHSPDLPDKNDKFSSQNPQDLCSFNFEYEDIKFEFDLEAFESHLLNETSKIRDDFSCSSYSSRDDFSCSSYSSECTELSPYLRIDHVISNASAILDEKLNEIMNFDSHVPSSLELLPHFDDMTKKPTCDHNLVEPLPQLDMKPHFFEEKRKPEGNHLPFKKRFTYEMKNEDLVKLQEVNNKPQELIHHVDMKIQDNITSTAHDIDEIQDDITSAMHDITLNDKKIQDDITPAFKCATPRSICATATSDLETPKRGISMNFVTPSPTSEESTRSSTSCQVVHSSKYSSAMSALVAFNLASNAASHSSFRPKRRSHHAPTNTSIYPPLKRESKASYFDSPSLPTPKKTSVSRVKCASTPSFLQTLTTPPAKSRLDPLSPKKNEILTSDESKAKKLRDIKKKLESRKLEDLFHGKKGSKSFIKNLSSLDSFTPCISSSILSSTAPIENKNVHRSSSISSTSSSFESFLTSSNHFEYSSSRSRLPSTSFVSSHESEDSPYSSETSSSSSETEFIKRKTSFVIKKRDLFHLHSSRFPSTRKVFKNHLDSKLPSCDFEHHNSFKEIKGPDKTLDLSSHKIIPERTSGPFKTSSSSHLSNPHSKSKVKATKYFKSPSSKAKPTKFSSSTCFSGSTSRARHPTLVRLANGKQPLCILTLVVLIIISLLLYLFLIKLLHLPFDRGKDSTFILIF